MKGTIRGRPRGLAIIALSGIVLLVTDLFGELQIVFVPDWPVISWLGRSVDTDYAEPDAFAWAISFVDIIWMMPLYLVACIGIWRMKRWGLLLGIGTGMALFWNVGMDMSADWHRGFPNIESVPLYLLFWVPYLVHPFCMVIYLFTHQSIFLERSEENTTT